MKPRISDSNQARIDAFCDAAWAESGLAKATLGAYGSDLADLAIWAEARALVDLGADELLSYLEHAQRKGLGARTLSRRLSSIRRFYAWAESESLVSADPSAGIKRPPTVRSLPTHISEEQIRAMFASPDPNKPIGLRDRAILETMYASGLRVSELVNAQLAHLDLATGILRVIGKGDRERLTPVGEEAIHWLGRYLGEARASILKAGDRSQRIFVSARSGRLTRQMCWHIIRRHAAAAIGYNASPHDLRHAFATHLVSHGADLRTVQLLLGHRSLSTTQIYTSVADERLRALHSRHHPRG